MPATLDGIDIETITAIRPIQRATITNIHLGTLPLQLTQNLKGMIHEYEVEGVWSNGDTDYDNKEAKVQNIQDGGLPVWFEATNWKKNTQIFGRVHDLATPMEEGEVNVTKFTFRITGVLPIGFVHIRDDGAGDFRVYDLDRFVKSRSINPIIRRCNWVKTSTTITFSIYVKNVGSSSGVVSLEIFLPDGLVAGDVTVSPIITAVVGNVGAAGFSAVAGTKNRAKLDRTLAVGVEEQWNITIANISGKKVTYFDNSIDEEPA